MGDHTKEETRRVMGAFLGALMDCGHDSQHVREVFAEWGFVRDGRCVLGEREYRSWFAARAQAGEEQK